MLISMSPFRREMVKALVYEFVSYLQKCEKGCSKLSRFLLIVN